MTMRGATNDKSANRLRGLFRVCVSALALIVLLFLVPVGDLIAKIAGVSPALWAAVLVAFLLGHAASAAKWRWMIGGDISYPRALKAHFAGLAANLALPGVAGGDIVRAGLVMKGSGRKTALAVGSLADRLIDTASLIFIAAIGAIWLGARGGVDPIGLGVAAALTAAVGFFGVIFIRPLAGLIRRLPPRGKIGDVASDVADAFENLSAKPGVLVGCALMSFGVQFAFALLNGLIAQDLGAGTSLSSWVFAWPLAKLIATLPISFGGLGVREASLAGLMTPLGYPAAGVVAASLVWQTIQYAAGGIGALAQMAGRNSTPAAAETNRG